MRHLKFAPLALAFAALLGAQPADPSKRLVLENRFVRLEFEPGGMGLATMVDRAGGLNHIGPVEGPHLLWEVAFAKGSQIERITNNYKPCTHVRLEELPRGGRRAVLEWKGLRWWLEDRVVSVRVTVDLPADSGIALWSVSVENRSDYWGLWSVAFPLVDGFPSAGKYDIARPVFAAGGHLLRRWAGSVNPVNSRLRATANIEGRHPSGLWPMQFLSFNQGANAVYLATMDSEGRAKDFVVEPAGRTSVVHLPENMGVTGSDYPGYYPIAFGVYQGGWVEAAHLYRQWALRQKWAAKLSRRAGLPDLIRNVGLWMQDGWVWNKTEGSPHEMNVPFLEAAKRMGVPLALHWYGWHSNRFDNQYPHFVPRPEFAARVKELVSAGLLVMPYINGTSADMNIPDFARFAPHAIRNEGGGYRMHFYSDSAGRLLSMCPAQEFWRETISVLAGELFAGQGVNGLYVDQVSAMNHELCFQPEHRHPRGGGRYWADGNRALLAKIRDLARRDGRQIVVTSEGADELFLDLLDANLTWAEPSDWEIPMMDVVYSGYAIFFGSRCDYTKSDRYFNLVQGRAFLAGRQNGWMNFGLFRPEHARKVEYLRECAKYRLMNRDFLLDGRLLQPLEPSRPVPAFTEDGFGWRIPKHAASVPSAEAALWQAEDGRLGVFFANYVEEPIPFSYRLDPAKFGLNSAELQLSEITPERRLPLGRTRGPIERTELLGPRRIKMIEIAPASGAARRVR